MGQRLIDNDTSGNEFLEKLSPAGQVDVVEIEEETYFRLGLRHELGLEEPAKRLNCPKMPLP